MRLRNWLLSLILLFIALPLAAQSRNEVEQKALLTAIDEASVALAAAERAGAPLWAKDLYDEATARAAAARAAQKAKDRSDREAARLRAVEAKFAAWAAAAKARYVAAAREGSALRDDIARFGGSVPTIDIRNDPPMTRGTTSADRVRFAENAIREAREAGGGTIMPDDLQQAEASLETAARIAKSQKVSASADHLAYVAEMIARRAYFLALLGPIDRTLPGLRLERTRLAQAASERQAAEDRRRREEAEARALEARRLLEAEKSLRRAEKEELERLRQQVIENERLIREQFSEDRLHRIEAERRLDALMSQYEAALAANTPSEADRLRRELEDQNLRLRELQERERLSEESMSREIDRLRRELAQERESGRINAQAAAERQAEIDRQQREFESIRSERASAERRRQEADRAYQAKIAEIEQRLRASEAEAGQLRQEVAQQKAQSEAAQAELQKARDEITRREAEERRRSEEMQKALSAIAQTRTESRGFVITLPGIFFDTGKSALKSGAKNVLTKIADQLKANADVKVMVEGHTDSVGSEASNAALSLARANAVRDHLVSIGIASARITTSGKGESAPVATNDTAAGRQQNRRVEIVISQ